MKILPSPFLQGIDEVMYMDSLPAGDTRNLPYIFLNGDYVLSKTAAREFFFQSFIFKTPIIFLIGWILCVIAAVRAKRLDVILLISLLPLLVLLFFTGFVHSKVGVRHILIIYPFVIMSAAIAFSKLKMPWYLVIFGIHMVMIFSYRNNLLAYTNELVWGDSNKIDRVGTVNLEYDQYRQADTSRTANYLYEIDNSIPVGDTVRMRVGNMFYIPDTIDHKHGVIKNYTIVGLDKKNTITAVKRTVHQKSNR
jgi:hypothetical protein